jgi:hypothetical protein
LNKKIQTVGIFLASVGLMSGCASFALADNIPGSFDAPWAYYSTDMSPIEVNFAAFFYDGVNNRNMTGHFDPVTKNFVEGSAVATAIIPRAYITAFQPYSSNRTPIPGFQFDTLPDNIVGHDLIITMTYPKGLPYSIVYETWPDHKPDMGLFGMGVGASKLASKKEQARALFMQATVFATPLNDARKSMLFDPKFTIGAGKRIEDREGFQDYLQPPSSWESYFDNGADEIRKIDCVDPTERALPDNFCSYTFPLNSKLVAKLDFIDFRLNGGREFARDRIRAFKKVMCPVFHCDEKALRAAEVKGGTQ